MQAVGGVDFHVAHIEVVEDAERDQRADALTIGRNFMQRVAAIVLRQRLDPVEAVRSQIGNGHHSAVGFRMSGDFFGEFAVVESLTFALGDLAQRGGLIGEGEFFAGQRSATARHESRGKTRLRFEFGYLIGPQPRDGWCDHIAALGVFNGRFK